MKRLSKFTLIFFLLLNFFTIAKSEIIEGFCLVKRSDLDIAKLATGDYYRFLGKEIKLLVSFDENLLADASDDGQLSVITGMYGGTLEFEETLQQNGKILTYKNEIDVTGDKETDLIKYSYKNKLQIVKDKITSFTAKVEQTGFSFNEWNFQIDCRDYPYTEDEKLEAKKKPINKKIDCPENMPKEMCEIMQKLDCPEDMSINECALKQANKLKKDKSPGEASNRMQEFLDQMKSGKKTNQMKGGKGSTESGTVKPKVESKITVNKNEILNMEAYAPFNDRALLTFSKAKFFNNDLTNYVFLKNRNYLKFKKGQKLTFEDVKELSERHFFGLPLHNRVDVDRLKKIKKEYFEKKKKLKKSS
jgi:hypothetical protein